MWYKSEQDGGIEYKAEGEVGSQVTIDQVIFTKFNVEAGVRQYIHVHWTEAFRWADFDSCGGMGLSGVRLSNGQETFARGLYFNHDQGGLAAVTVGCYGPVWLKRDKRPARDKHGFPIRAAA